MTQFHHREVNGADASILTGSARPAPGEIAVLPEGHGRAHAEAVREAGGVVGELSASTRGIVYTSYRNVDPLIEALDAYPEIGWVQLPFAGIDTFAKRLAPFAERGLVVTSARGAFAQPVAEHALALTLALQRGLQVRARATKWGNPFGLSLYGANVVLVGAGGIAIEYLSLLRPFAVTSTVVRRSSHVLNEADRTVSNEEFDTVLAEADVILLAAPATDETRHIINADRLARMKPTAVLVNVGRGPLVDTNALVSALDAGQIFGAALDVTEPEPLPEGHPLWLHERCLITPHSADTPEMTLPLLLTRIRDNVRGFLSTGEFVGIVDPRQGY